MKRSMTPEDMEQLSQEIVELISTKEQQYSFCASHIFGVLESVKLRVDRVSQEHYKRAFPEKDPSVS